MYQVSFGPHFLQRSLTAALLLAGLCGTLAAVIFSNQYATVLGPTLFVSVLTAIFIQSTNCTWPKRDSDHLPKAALLYLNVAVIIFALYYLFGQRTIHVFAATAVLFVISIFVLFRVHARAGLALLILTAIIQRATIYFSSPVMLGNDVLWHASWIELIQGAGSTQPLSTAESRYATTPLYHVFVTIVKDFTGLSVQTTSFFALSIPYTVLPALIVYSIAKDFEGVAAGGVAAILFLFADQAIGWSVEPQPTSFGLVLFAIAIYLYLRILDTPTRPLAVALGVVGLATAVMHQVSAAILLTTLTALTVSHFIYTRDRQIARLAGGLNLAIIVFTVVIWTIPQYSRAGTEGSFLPFMILNIISKLSSIGVSQRTSTIAIASEIPAASGGSQSLSLIHFVGSGILFFLGMYGGLAQVRESSPRSSDYFTILSAVLVLLGVAFAGPVLDFTVLQPTRWIQFMYFLLAILGGVGAVSLVGHLPADRRTPTLGTLLLAYLILMSGSATASPDGPLFDDSYGATSDSLTERDHELLLFVHQSSTEENYVGGDHHARVVLERHLGTTTSTIRWKQGHGLVTEDRALIVDRPYLHSGHASYYYAKGDQAGRVLGYLPGEISCNTSSIYSSGTDNKYEYQVLYSETGC